MTGEPQGTRTEVVGVFGGAFDPPHLGHVLVPAHVLGTGACDRVLVVPAFVHPHGKAMSAYATRLQWVRSAFACYGPAVEVSDAERQLAAVRADATGRTLDLLEWLAHRMPAVSLRCVLGSDQYRQRDRWHAFDEIERRFSPIVVPRTGFVDAGVPALPPISSSEVRDLLARAPIGDPEAEAGLRARVPAVVLAQIRPSHGPVLVVGQGQAGQVVVPWLARRGMLVRAIGARALRGGTVPRVGTQAACAWLLCAESELEAIAASVAHSGLLAPGAPMLHAAGGRRACEVLAPGRAAGHPVATLHPICSLRAASPRAVEALSRASFGAEGDPEALAWARRLTAPQPMLDLAGLDASGRAAYHAACALAGNHLGVLLHEAQRVWERLGIDGGPALGRLMASAMEHLEALGIADGTSGPAARGDQTVLAAHARALAPDDALYRELSARLSALLGPR